MWHSKYTLAAAECWVVDGVPNDEGNDSEDNGNAEGVADATSELINNNLTLTWGENIRLVNQTRVFEDGT